MEWSGAVAENAQLILVTAKSQSATDDTLYDAESYIVSKVTAPVLSVSYGECELFLGTAGNAEYNTLWQDAASEGIAVFVAAGDSGSASCDDSLDSGPPYVAEDGLSVSGLASTPYNTAVGGTDFNWCPPLTLFNGGTCSASPYWNSTNSATGASAVGYVPETPWNETCTNPVLLGLLQALGNYIDGSNVTNTEQACNIIGNNLSEDSAGDLEQNYPYAVYLLNTVGGGGGASGCTSSDGSTVASCKDGYTKPSWQVGVAGIPGDGKRDLPDVSFFSADGTVSESAYLICVSENGGNCVYSADSEPIASEVGGTSASTPPMAAVMALINQKTGAPQGFANPELYKLAAQQSYSSCSAESVTTSGACMFNDIDAGPISGFAGNNAMPCDYGAGGDPISPNCTALSSIEGYPDTVGILTTGTKAGYTAGTGYDQATGLGSLNVANLVSDWPAISGGAAVTVTVTPAQTTLSATQTLGVTGTVGSSPAGGAAPTGTVTLTAGSYTATATLSGGAYSFTITANSLAVGTDTINVSYSGDATYSTGSGTAIVTVNGNGSTFSLTQPAVAVTPAGGIAPGSSANAAVTVSSVLGYAGTVTLTCSESSSSSTNSATDAPSCTGGGSGLPVTLPNSTAQVINFTVTTTAPGTTTVNELKRRNTASNHREWLGAGGGTILSLLVFLGVPARRRSWRAMLGMVMLLVALGSLAACGGGSSGGGGTTTNTDPGTSAGSYVFTVTAVGTPSVSPAVSTTFTVVVN